MNNLLDKYQTRYTSIARYTGTPAQVPDYFKTLADEAEKVKLTAEIDYLEKLHFYQLSLMQTMEREHQKRINEMTAEIAELKKKGKKK
jgi:hypothetical protein